MIGQHFWQVNTLLQWHSKRVVRWWNWDLSVRWKLLVITGFCVSDSTEWVSVVSLSHENRLWLCFEMKDGFQMPISVCFRQWIDEQEIWNKKIEEAAFDQD